MAKVKIKNLDKIAANIKKTFEKVRTDQGLLLELGKTYCDYVRIKARAGTSLATSSKLPKLEKSSIKNREYLAENNTPHATFKAGRSNLTITGQLLDSIKPTKIIANKGTVEVDASGVRNPYRNSDGIPIRSQETSNSKILSYLKAKGFYIFGKDQAITKRLSIAVRRFIRRQISKGLGK